MIDLDVKRAFAGRYRVVRRIAAGGMGAVFEVVHVETERHRALKVMLPELVANQELRARFQMEARVTAKIQSEHVVDVFDAGVDDQTGMPFLVMELLEGTDLGKELEQAGPLTPEFAITCLQQVAAALDKTHAAAIVHRDLKPENLFLTRREDGTPKIKILDFGISKVITDARTGGTRNLGTPLYMAPEQALGQRVTSATDTYALAMIAYTLLVGVSYWQSDADRLENALTFLMHASRGASEGASLRAAAVGRTLPAGFDAWFARAVHVNPAERFQRASELVAELAAVFRVQLPRSVSIVPPTARAHTGVPAVSGQIATLLGTSLDPARKSSGRRRASLAIVLVACAAAALTVAFALRKSASGTPSAETAPALSGLSATGGAGAPSALAPSATESATPPLAPADRLSPDGLASATPGASTGTPSTATSPPAATTPSKSAPAPIVKPAVAKPRAQPKAAKPAYTRD